MDNIVFDKFDYQGWLTEKFSEILNQSEINIDFKISEEQQFVSDTNKQPNTLYIVYKQLVGPTSYNIKSVPYQILIMSEENQLEFAKVLANKFVEINNFATTPVGNTFIKHAYSQPSILSNFNQIDVGVRSIIYIPATLQMMARLSLLTGNGTDEYGIISVRNENWEADVREDIKYVSLNLNYSMVGDTQQFDDSEIAKTLKSTATASLSIVIPLYNNNFCKDLLKMMIKTNPTKGNTIFNFQFYVGDISYDLDMKCISAQMDDAPDQAPGLRLGFMM